MGEITIDPKHNVFKKYRTVNYLNSYVFAPPVNLTTNTEIGGVASTISTPALLATKLAIDVSRITNFSIVGSDIKCKITGSYVIPLVCFDGNASITYYIDSDGLVTDLGGGCFRGATNLKGKLEFNGVLVLTGVGGSILDGSGVKTLILNNCTEIAGTADIFYQAYELKRLYIPKVIKIGATIANNNIFSTNLYFDIYAHPTMQTINSGGVEGDIQGNVSRGGKVTYVLNQNIPNPPTSIAVGNVYNTAVQLNFTPSTGSVNAIDFYEVYENGVLKNEILNGGYVINLTPSITYNFKLIAVDIYGNRSVFSSSITATTNTSKIAYPTNGLVSSYKLNETTGTIASDSYGSAHLTNSGISINQAGKLGTAYVSTASNQNLSATGVAPITGNFTINTWIYRTASANGGNDVIVEQGDYSAGFGIWIAGNNQLGWFVNTSYLNYSSYIPPLNSWVMVSLVYDGATIKLFVNNKLIQRTLFTTNPNSATTRRFFNRISNSEAYIGRIDETSFYNKALNEFELYSHWDNGNGNTL